MPSPLSGATYLRPPKRSGTREEVLARTFAQLEKSLSGLPDVECREERLNRYADELIDKTIWQWNLEASFRPEWQVTGPMQPTYTDERLRNYRGRFGHTRSD